MSSDKKKTPDDDAKKPGAGGDEPDERDERDEDAAATKAASAGARGANDEDDDDDDDDDDGEPVKKTAPLLAPAKKAPPAAAAKTASKSTSKPESAKKPEKASGAKKPDDGEPAPPLPPLKASVWTRGAARWAAISLVLTFFYIVYTKHPYYLRDQFTPWRPIFRSVFIGWLVLGLPYVVAALKEFSRRSQWMSDIGLHFLLIGRGLYKKFFQKKRASHIWKSRRIRITLRSLVVKAFFTPLMTTFLSGHLNSISNHWLRKKGIAPFNFGSNTSADVWWTTVKAKLPLLVPNGRDFSSLMAPSTWTIADMRWGLDIAYDLVFIVDCGIATMGYLSESRFLGNKTKSVEPTGFGWAVAIGCYPPFNNVLGTYFPLGGGRAHITDEKTLLLFKLLTVLLFSIYAAATVAFGFKFSNLTHRGVITRGPYRFIRHPAYVCKCLAWWLEYIPNITPETAIFLCGTCTVYALRAWTEERHLSMDPEYRAYKKKVPWVAIPHVY